MDYTDTAERGDGNMGLFSNQVTVTGRYAFTFTTIIWDHEWDGRDYAYFHDVDEEQGLKAFKILEKELGVSGRSLKELFRLKFGETLNGEEGGDAVFDFCIKNGIKYAFQAVQI